MNKLSRFLLGLSLVLACCCITAAQEKSQANSIPKVLQITREYTKPGRAGNVHEAAESAFVQAAARAKWPTHYLAMTSLSGKQRALFLTSYASLEAWEKDTAAVAKNPTLSAALDAASVADGEQLDSIDQGVFVFNEEMSLRPVADLSQMRFMELSIYRVRPGHEREWSEAVKMVKAAYEKGVPGSHWGVFNQVYGGEGGSYLVLTSRKTLAEVDHGFQVEDKQFEAAIGADGMKKLDELIAASVESSLHQLFAFNPHMSYVADEWIKADPDFWKP
ncbi:MAG TPA: hypothetical protein VOA88_15225 [Candidatus Dormibacteraeota bacterium]|nr:hypothetical protein [Candidatus Dormibacteraeota bacterium]